MPSAIPSSFEPLEETSYSGGDHQVAQLRIPPHSIRAESSALGALPRDHGAWDRVGSRNMDSSLHRHSPTAWAT